jgi:hypothetical protein
LRQQQLEHAVSVGLREVLDGDRARVAAVELGQIAAAGGRELGCLDVPTEETDLDGKVSEGITQTAWDSIMRGLSFLPSSDFFPNIVDSLPQ